MKHKLYQDNSFHLVDPSPWPLRAGLAAVMLTFGGVIFFYGYVNGSFLSFLDFMLILHIVCAWCLDITREEPSAEEDLCKTITDLCKDFSALPLNDILYQISEIITRLLECMAGFIDPSLFQQIYDLFAVNETILGMFFMPYILISIGSFQFRPIVLPIFFFMPKRIFYLFVTELKLKLFSILQNKISPHLNLNTTTLIVKHK